MLTKEQKVKVVSEIVDSLSDQEAMIISDYSNLKVNEFSFKIYDGFLMKGEQVYNSIAYVQSDPIQIDNLYMIYSTINILKTAKIENQKNAGAKFRQ